MKWKFAFSSLAVLSLTVCSLTGCGGGDTAPAPRSTRADREAATPAPPPATTDTAAEPGPAEVGDEPEPTASPEQATVATPEPTEVADARPTTPSASPAAGEPADSGYGHLTGRFIFDGTPPTPAKVNVTKDVEFCTQNHPLDESVVVNADNRGLANVVVSLYLGRGDKAPAAHPSYQEVQDANVLLDNKFCRFEPHVTFVRTNQPLTIGNSDPIGHNTNASMLSNPPFNDLVPANGSLKKTFSSAEAVPIPISCSIHPWMKGHLIVKDHPYVAITDEDGNFMIRSLPAGKHTFQLWHEKPGFVSDVTVNGKKTTWSKGRTEFTIPNGGTLDLGEIKVPASAFK